LFTKEKQVNKKKTIGQLLLKTTLISSFIEMDDTHHLNHLNQALNRHTIITLIIELIESLGTHVQRAPHGHRVVERPSTQRRNTRPPPLFVVGRRCHTVADFILGLLLRLLRLLRGLLLERRG
jgi:hypothetical protein